MLFALFSYIDSNGGVVYKPSHSNGHYDHKTLEMVYKQLLADRDTL
jgi:hypothetical protein